MLVVVVDSSTPAITAALVRVPSGGTAVQVLAEQVSMGARAHGELLAPAVAAVLAQGGVTAAELGAVVAGLGPGPFTGLRVGLVTAAAFSHALGIPAYGVCSLDALGLGQPGLTLVATDARRREVYWAIYDGGVRIAGPAVDRPVEVAAQARARGAVRAVGDGALMYADVLDVPVADDPRHPPAAALATLAAQRIGAGAPTEPLTPLYLRRPDATVPVPGGRKAVLSP